MYTRIPPAPGAFQEFYFWMTSVRLPFVSEVPVRIRLLMTRNIFPLFDAYH